MVHSGTRHVEDTPDFFLGLPQGPFLFITADYNRMPVRHTI